PALPTARIFPYTTLFRCRECERCGFRFTTFERMEEVPLIVVKKDGARQEFSREKLIRGLIKACEKRPRINFSLLNSCLDPSFLKSEEDTSELKSRFEFVC